MCGCICLSPQYFFVALTAATTAVQQVVSFWPLEASIKGNYLLLPWVCVNFHFCFYFRLYAVPQQAHFCINLLNFCHHYILSMWHCANTQSIFFSYCVSEWMSKWVNEWMRRHGEPQGCSSIKVCGCYEQCGFSLTYLPLSKVIRPFSLPGPLHQPGWGLD